MSLMRKPPTQNFGQEPRRSKLVNFLRTVREEKYDPPNVSAREIQEWCEAHKGPPADDDDHTCWMDYVVVAETPVL